MISEIIAIALLLVLSAFFSGSEAALTSLSNHSLHHFKRKKGYGIKSMVYLKKNPGIMLATILIGNNLVNIAIASLATLIVLDLFHWANWHNPLYISPFTTFITTIILLVFGEVMPKTLSLSNSLRVSLWASPIVRVLSIVFRPFVFVLNKFSNYWLKLLGGQSLDANSLVTEEEIISLIAAGEESGSIKKDEKQMLQDVLEFGDMLVGEVMTPVDNIIAFEENMNLRQMFNLLRERTPSRIPVYSGSKRNIYGMLYLKDLILKADQLKDLDNFILKDNQKLIRKPFVVYIDQKTSEVLKQLKFHRTHIALVKNHSDKVVGLVTMEDLIEEIVGEIHDEYENNPFSERRQVKPISGKI